jgi:hypothetical protein
VGALRAPNRPATAPIDVEWSPSGSRNAAVGAWQSAHDWPVGRDRLLSLKISLPSCAFVVAEPDEQPAMPAIQTTTSATRMVGTVWRERRIGKRERAREKRRSERYRCSVARYSASSAA